MAEQYVLSWKKSVKIFKNSLILKQLGLVIGIPFGILLLFMIWAKAYYGVLMVGLLLSFTYIFVMIFYRGSYDVEYVIDKKGVRCRYQDKQRKKNAVVNWLLIFIGLFSSRPTLAGVGMLAGSRQDEFITWKRIRKVKYLDRSSTIVLKGGFAENITVFCDPDEYIQVKELVKSRVGGSAYEQ